MALRLPQKLNDPPFIFFIINNLPQVRSLGLQDDDLQGEETRRRQCKFLRGQMTLGPAFVLKEICTFPVEFPHLAIHHPMARECSQ